MKLLKLDIETAPHMANVWGFWNQNIHPNQVLANGYILCFAGQWHGKKKIEFYSQHKDGEQKMIEAAWGLLNDADAVIHYNGIEFDIPHLNKEFAKYRMPPPSSYHQIDLMRTVKQQFKLPRNRLDDVLKFFGLETKVSHEGHELWMKCMSGDPKAWKTMKKYNIQDVKVLGELYELLRPWIKTHPNFALYVDSSHPVCTNCGSESVHSKGLEHTKTLSYRRYKCMDCGANLRGRSNVLSKEKKKTILVRSSL